MSKILREEEKEGCDREMEREREREKKQKCMNCSQLMQERFFCSLIMNKSQVRVEKNQRNISCWGK